MSDDSPDGSGERILLKLSGEVLAGPDRRGIDTAVTAAIAGASIGTVIRVMTRNSLAPRSRAARSAFTASITACS